jgi:hypothetical protein
MPVLTSARTWRNGYSGRYARSHDFLRKCQAAADLVVELSAAMGPWGLLLLFVALCGLACWAQHWMVG